MPNILTPEFAEKKKPIILICGDHNPFVTQLVLQYVKDLRIILLTNNEKLQSVDEQTDSIVFINPESIKTIQDFKEKIDYALFFLKTEGDTTCILELLPKLENDKTKIAIISTIRTVQRFYDFLLLMKGHHTLSYVFLGDLFGEKIFYEDSYIARIIEKIRTSKTIILTGNDLSPIFPISDQDAIKGINTIIFGNLHTNGMYYLFYQHPKTLLSSVHILQQLEPGIEIQFDNTKESENSSTFEDLEKDLESKFSSKPTFLDINFLGFEKSLERILKQTMVPQSQISQSTIIPSLPKYTMTIHSGFKKRIGAIFLLFATSVIFYALFNIILSLLALLYLSRGVSAFEKHDVSSASNNTLTAKYITSFIDPSITSNNIGFLKNIPVFRKYQDALQIVPLAGLAAENFTKIKTMNILEDQEALRTTIADIHFLYFQLATMSIEEPKFDKRLDNILDHTSVQLLPLSQTLYELIGYQKEKTYLLLFQNNGELRPTGGFIGSVGEISFSKGKVTNFLIRDVYEADGQLKAHLEPHYIIRRYLQPHLYLRDSNFNLDFESAARYADKLYRLETNTQVDGVIALDYEVMRRIIKEIGPITLSSYKKTLDKNNMFEFIQQSIDANAFPGSNEKRDLLLEILNQLTVRLEESQDNRYKIARIVPELLKEKHILFAFSDESVQSIFRINGLSGSYQDLRDKKETTLSDFLSINEANIGVNKANMYMKRSVEYNLNIEQKGVTSQATLHIDNTGEKTLDYKSYIRVTSPIGSTLTLISIDGEEQQIASAVTDYTIYEKKGFKAPSGLEVDNSIEEDKQVFGFIISVPKKSSQTIEVSYRVEGEFVNLKNYNLLYIKQPGTDQYPLKLTVHYPDRNYTFSNEYELSGDKEINFEFVKK